MHQGICVDTGLSAVLQKGNTYFLKEHGKNNYYVSRFDNPKSYFGSFRKEFFTLVAEKKPKLKRFIARVTRNRSWYTVGDEYIITEKDHTGYFHVYFKDIPSKPPIGSYLDSFFEVIEPFNEAEGEKLVHISKPQKEERREDTTSFGQMNLFDFIDG